MNNFSASAGPTGTAADDDDAIPRMPDFVNIGVAFISSLCKSGNDAVFELSVLEPWSWQVGVAVLCKFNLADKLLEPIAERLAWQTVSAGVRGTNVELLIAVALRLATDLPKRIKRLVDDAQRLSSPVALPNWYVCVATRRFMWNCSGRSRCAPHASPCRAVTPPA